MDGTGGATPLNPLGGFSIQKGAGDSIQVTGPDGRNYLKINLVNIGNLDLGNVAVINKIAQEVLKYSSALEESGSKEAGGLGGFENGDLVNVHGLQRDGAQVLSHIDEKSEHLQATAAKCNECFQNLLKIKDFEGSSSQLPSVQIEDFKKDLPGVSISSYDTSRTKSKEGAEESECDTAMTPDSAPTESGIDDLEIKADANEEGEVPRTDGSEGPEIGDGVKDDEVVLPLTEENLKKHLERLEGQPPSHSRLGSEPKKATEEEPHQKPDTGDTSPLVEEESLEDRNADSPVDESDGGSEGANSDTKDVQSDNASQERGQELANKATKKWLDKTRASTAEKKAKDAADQWRDQTDKSKARKKQVEAGFQKWLGQTRKSKAARAAGKRWISKSKAPLSVDAFKGLFEGGTNAALEGFQKTSLKLDMKGLCFSKALLESSDFRGATLASLDGTQYVMTEKEAKRLPQEAELCDLSAIENPTKETVKLKTFLGIASEDELKDSGIMEDLTKLSLVENSYIEVSGTHKGPETPINLHLSPEGALQIGEKSIPLPPAENYEKSSYSKTPESLNVSYDKDVIKESAKADISKISEQLEPKVQKKRAAIIAKKEEIAKKKKEVEHQRAILPTKKLVLDETKRQLNAAKTEIAQDAWADAKKAQFEKLKTGVFNKAKEKISRFATRLNQIDQKASLARDRAKSLQSETRSQLEGKFKKEIERKLDAKIEETKAAYQSAVEEPNFTKEAEDALIKAGLDDGFVKSLQALPEAVNNTPIKPKDPKNQAQDYKTLKNYAEAKENGKPRASENILNFINGKQHEKFTISETIEFCSLMIRAHANRDTSLPHQKERPLSTFVSTIFDQNKLYTQKLASAVPKISRAKGKLTKADLANKDAHAYFAEFVDKLSASGEDPTKEMAKDLAAEYKERAKEKFLEGLDPDTKLLAKGLNQGNLEKKKQELADRILEERIATSKANAEAGDFEEKDLQKLTLQNFEEKARQLIPYNALAYGNDTLIKEKIKTLLDHAIQNDLERDLKRDLDMEALYKEDLREAGCLLDAIKTEKPLRELFLRVETEGDNIDAFVQDYLTSNQTTLRELPEGTFEEEKTIAVNTDPSSLSEEEKRLAVTKDGKPFTVDELKTAYNEYFVGGEISLKKDLKTRIATRADAEIADKSHPKYQELLNNQKRLEDAKRALEESEKALSALEEEEAALRADLESFLYETPDFSGTSLTPADFTKHEVRYFIGAEAKKRLGELSNKKEDSLGALLQRKFIDPIWDAYVGKFEAKLASLEAMKAEYDDLTISFEKAKQAILIDLKDAAKKKIDDLLQNKEDFDLTNKTALNEVLKGAGEEVKAIFNKHIKDIHLNASELLSILNIVKATNKDGPTFTALQKAL